MHSHEDILRKSSRQFVLFCLLHTNVQTGCMYCRGSSELEHQEAGKLLTERLMLTPPWQLATTWSSWTDVCGFRLEMTECFIWDWFNYDICVRSYSWQHQQRGTEIPPCIFSNMLPEFQGYTKTTPLWRFTLKICLHSLFSVLCSTDTLQSAQRIWYCTTICEISPPAAPCNHKTVLSFTVCVCIYF